jgi:DNA-binding beta-propeller fold protein YncE
MSLGDAAAAGDPAVNTKFWGPRGIALDSSGNVYVTDTGNKRVLIFDGNGKYLRQIASGMSPEKIAASYPFSQPGEMNEPIGIAVDGSGAVYVADTNNRRIQKFDAAGKFVTQWPVGGTNWDAGPYLEPFLALDSAGNLYVAAPTGQKILKFGPAGQPIAEKSAQGAVSLKTPTGVTVAADGNVYVVDVGSNGVVNLGTIP